MDTPDQLQSSFLKQVQIEMYDQANYSVKSDWYDQFIAQYGTHYFANGIFGTRRLEATQLEADYYYSTSPGHIIDCIRATFYKQDKIDAIFKENSKVFPFQFGHLRHPWLLKAGIKPITDLFPSGQLKTQLTIAIQVYMTKAVLSEWKRDLDQMQKVGKLYWIFMGNFDPEDILSRIESALSDTVPDLNEVKQIGHSVETMVTFMTMMNGNVLQLGIVCA